MTAWLAYSSDASNNAEPINHISISNVGHWENQIQRESATQANERIENANMTGFTSSTYDWLNSLHDLHAGLYSL